jgi:peptidoglycan hydrolase-like protein with peptidoglycan-binding domain
MHAEATMNLWQHGLTGVLWCLLATVAFAQTPATLTAPARTPSHLDSQHIREIQRTLELLDLDPGPVDGVMGPRTKAALIRFQRAEQLSPTGAPDRQTWAKLVARQHEHVLQVQRALKAAGIDSGPTDGVMGNRTKSALRDYAKAPAPAPPTPSSQLIDRFRRVYESSLQQSP